LLEKNLIFTVLIRTESIQKMQFVPWQNIADGIAKQALTVANSTA
jgi:hypothetical protein